MEGIRVVGRSLLVAHQGGLEHGRVLWGMAYLREISLSKDGRIFLLGIIRVRLLVVVVHLFRGIEILPRNLFCLEHYIVLLMEVHAQVVLEFELLEAARLGTFERAEVKLEKVII